MYGKVSPINFPNISDYRNPFIAEAMKILGYVNRFSRGVYRVQKELKENGNGAAIFDFSLRTAFRVVENISKKYFEEGFGIHIGEKDYPENIQKLPRKYPGTTQKPPRNYPETTQKTLRKLPKNS